MTNKEQFYTFDVYYTDEIVMELDSSIKDFIKEYLKDRFSINSEWYYSEFSISQPSYRLIGFELARNLSDLERFQLIDALISEFDGFVKPQ